MAQRLKIDNGVVVDTETGEVLSQYNFYINSDGFVKYRAKRKYVRKHNINIMDFIHSEYQKCIKKGNKIGSIYFKVVDYMAAVNMPMTKEVLERIAEYCDYSNGWIKHKIVLHKIKP